MTKDELLTKIKNERLDKILLPWRIKFDKISDSSLVIGCVKVDGKWQVFKTRERGGHYIVKAFDDENEAYDFFYESLEYLKRLSRY
ncbi:MAG: hypothetical protein ACC608_02535 [Anaerofustis sp.]